MELLETEVRGRRRSVLLRLVILNEVKNLYGAAIFFVALRMTQPSKVRHRLTDLARFFKKSTGHTGGFALKTNILREKLKSGVPTIGGWLTLNNSSIAELMASVGYDWIVVDCEHSTISYDDLLHICQGIDCAGKDTVTIARVATPDRGIMKRTLDTGVQGVVVPMLETPEQFEEAVAATRFSPEGVRGICSARANRWDMEFEEYVHDANRSIIVIAQIERIKAVERIDDILKVDGIDAVIIGPDDLSASMGHRGDSGHPDVTAAINHVFEACRRAGTPYGRHVMTVEAAIQHADMGCTFIPLSQDVDTFWEAALGMVTRVRNAVLAGAQLAAEPVHASMSHS